MHTTETKKPLQVLNASAGSGKTYHLVKAYISLLIGGEPGPNPFAHIIAMTFTNKAALEMKVRIVQALDQIGSDIPAISSLTGLLSEELGLPEPEVEERCRKVLSGILHRYEEFHIMTIDKFNLRLIKSFGRDLDLPHDFEVTLNENELIEKIVDQLLSQLGDQGAGELNRLILSYAKSNLEEGTQWNFRQNLIDFGKILNSEKNHAIVERLLTMDFSTERHSALRARRQVIDQSFAQYSSRLKTAVQAHGLSADMLPGKSATLNAILRLCDATSFDLKTPLLSDSFLKYMDAPLKPGQDFPEEVKAILREIYAYHEAQYAEYNSLVLFLKNFFNMALLQYMAEELKEVRKNEQLIRISEFNTLISQLIQEESTPFIYERLGTKFHHFLLDEFQDTSRLQWLNMVPLVRESLSQQKENLIVGDPKQSIYRFKNGVAEQFVALPSIHNPENDSRVHEHSAYFRQMGTVSELDSNWRSAPTIVDFNNQYFTHLRSLVPAPVAEFYNSISQVPRSSLKGRVRIVSKEEAKTTDELLPDILEWIRECLDNGYQPGDLCILGGTNRECNRWALGLHQAGFKVVSSESLLIHNNLRVQLAIAYIRLRIRPGGTNEMKRFAELYFRISGGSYLDYQRYFREETMQHGKKIRFFDSMRFLQEHFRGADSFFYKFESVYDLFQQFFAITGFVELEDPYLHHLADFAFDFGLHKGPDLRGFLAEYERKKHKLAVQIPESSDAIQVMTIHKSKGLEFPVVMVPSMNFSGDIKGNFLVDLDDFVVYKRPSRNDTISVLRELHDKELEQIIADNMNKCYVAMTRPQERLYIANYHDGKSFGNLFHEALALMPGIHEEEGVLLADLDDGSGNPRLTSDSKDELFVPTDIREHLWFPHIALQDRPELADTDFLSEEMQYGRSFHLMAATIHESGEIDDTLEKAARTGDISKQHLDALRKDLHELFRNPAYLSLFESAQKVLSEQSIIAGKGIVLRPDKIILKEHETILLDYKTGIPSAKDERQIRQYQQVLAEMHFANVSAYLFYSSIRELRQIG